MVDSHYWTINLLNHWACKGVGMSRKTFNEVKEEIKRSRKQRISKQKIRRVRICLRGVVWWPCMEQYDQAIVVACQVCICNKDQISTVQFNSILFIQQFLQLMLSQSSYTDCSSKSLMQKKTLSKEKTPKDVRKNPVRNQNSKVQAILLWLRVDRS